MIKPWPNICPGCRADVAQLRHSWALKTPGAKARGPWGDLAIVARIILQNGCFHRIPKSWWSWWNTQLIFWVVILGLPMIVHVFLVSSYVLGYPHGMEAPSMCLNIKQIWHHREGNHPDFIQLCGLVSPKPCSEAPRTSCHAAMASHGSQNDQAGGHLQQRVEAVEIDDFIDEDDWLMDIQHTYQHLSIWYGYKFQTYVDESSCDW